MNAKRHFAVVAHWAWADRIANGCHRVVIRSAKAILSDKEREAHELVQMVLVVQWVLLPAYRERIPSTSFRLMMGRTSPSDV